MSEPKVFKVRVELPSGEAVLLPKVSASTTEDLTSNVAKDLAEMKVWDKEVNLSVMDSSFGEYFKLTPATFAELDEGPVQVKLLGVAEEGQDKPDAEAAATAPKKFEVERKEIRDEKTGDLIDTQVTIVILNRNLRDYLRGEISNDELYEVQPRIKAHELLVHLKALKDRMADYEPNVKESPFYDLVEFLDKEFGDITRKLDAMIADGLITFQYLWYLFKKGTPVWGYESATEAKVGAEVASFSYRNVMMWSFFAVQGRVYVSDGQHFFNWTHEFTIMEFKGVKKISDLPVKMLDEETKKELTKRGELFKTLGIGCHYKKYKGNIIRKSWFGSTFFKADGRVMVDGSSFRRLNPNYGNEVFRHGSRESSSETIDDASSWMTWPSLLAFSFSAKKWGEVLVEDLSDIVFDDHAFDRLVMAPEKKQMVRALVENQRGTFSDIISGKSGGCIFLLHGSPGVGKTLTAEAIAELLHHPLYSVSVGELGTSTDVLEERLREILEVASTWNAVVLLDEADIFLEKRNESDISRNAMVGIFLRLLEYHQGVLFLTTNRVKSFDPAFHSRISIALKYRDLTEDARAQIWKNFLELAKITSPDVDAADLAKHDINGRQIKTTVRLAQALAAAENKPVGKEHIMRTLNVTEQFKRDMLKTSQGDHW